MTYLVNKHKREFMIDLNQPPEYQGGKNIIKRLIHLFGVGNRLQLADLLGVTQGTLSTWMTRDSTPYEILIRVHLATGVPMEYLCFGINDDDSKVDLSRFDKSNELFEYTASYSTNKIDLFKIENGELTKQSKNLTSFDFLAIYNINIDDGDYAIQIKNEMLFIDSSENTVTNGRYLISINNSKKIAELRLLPDGNVYYFDDNEKYPINTDITKVLGKVTAVLEAV